MDEGVDACNGYITASVGCWGLMQLVGSTLHSIIDVNNIISFVNKYRWKFQIIAADKSTDNFMS